MLVSPMFRCFSFRLVQMPAEISWHTKERISPLRRKSLILMPVDHSVFPYLRNNFPKIDVDTDFNPGCLYRKGLEQRIVDHKLQVIHRLTHIARMQEIFLNWSGMAGMFGTVMT